MKKIVIFTTSGGGGHMTVTEALIEYLQKDYNVTSVEVFADVLRPLDLIQTITFRHYTAEQWYNYFARRKWFKLLNILLQAGLWYFSFFKKKAQTLISNYIKQQKPDLIISVAPLINQLILNTAKKSSTPFVLVPTDLDAATFIYGLTKPEYKKFKILLSFDDPKILKTIEPAHIKKEHIKITGFPVRPAFLKVKNQDKAKLKKLLNIPENKPIVMILMGAQGSRTSYLFAEQLSQLAMPVHLLFCLGKSEEIGKKIENIEFPAQITKTIFGFTDKIAELMTVSDVIITKSGSVSVSEAIYMDLPMLLDATSTILKWEQFNHAFIKDHHFGGSIHHYDDISEIITGLLFDTTRCEYIRKNLKKFKKENPIIEIPKEIARSMDS